MSPIQRAVMLIVVSLKGGISGDTMVLIVMVLTLSYLVDTIVLIVVVVTLMALILVVLTLVLVTPMVRSPDSSVRGIRKSLTLWY